MSEKIRLQIIGGQKMHCAGCERTVSFTLSQLPGIEDVSADYKTQLIDLEIDTAKIGLEKITAELDWIGYEVTTA